MSQLSLSTMWGKNKQKHMREFVREAHRSGYSHLELHSTLTDDRLRELFKTEEVGISSVHSPCPEMTSRTLKSRLSLSCLNKETRRKAVARGVATIELAARVGARAVVVHAGEVELESPLVVKLRQLYEQGPNSSKEFEEIKKVVIEERATKVEPHLQAAKESIGKLLDVASENGILLGLENRVHYHEIPSLDEMEQFLAVFEGSPIGYWHDVGHAEVQERLGFQTHQEWFSRLGSRIIGVHLHDIQGIHDHQAPGIGSLNWDFVAGNIPDNAIKVCEIGEWNSPDHVLGAIPFLKSKSIIE